MSRIVFFAAACLINLIVAGQSTQVVFDRPGIADSPYLATGCAQLEAGFAWNPENSLSSSLNPSVLLRKTFLKKQEVRVTYNYLPQASDYMYREYPKDLTNLALGLKRSLFAERGFLPEASIIVNTFFPTNVFSSGETNNLFNFEVGLQFQNNFNHSFALNYNLNYIFNTWNSSKICNYSICLNYGLNQHFTFFAEHFYFGNLQSGFNEFCFDAGIMYQPNGVQQIDLSYIINDSFGLVKGTLLLGYSYAFGTGI